MKQKIPIFRKSVTALSICIFMCFFYAQKGDKERNAFQNISGIVNSIENINEHYSGKDISKFRYIEINNYPQSFQIFIGKSTGDFRPEFENIDNVKVGDSLTIYFEESSKTRNAAVNNLAYFIDRKSETIFIKGNSIKIMIYGLAIFCTLFIVLLIILKAKGKII
jgi:hypothetical protein